MNTSRSLPAFTIMELMVVALLSVILVSTALTAFRLIESQYIDYLASTEESLDLQQLHRLLLEDAQSAQTISREATQLVFQFPTHQLQYQFTTDQTIRQVLISGVRADTFAIGGIFGAMQWQGIPQTKGPIDQLQISLKTKTQSHPVLLNKLYSAEERMRSQLSAQQ